MKPEELKQGVVTALGKTTIANTCVQLVDALLTLSPNEGEFLTFTSLQKLLGHGKIDADLVQAVQFLTSSRFHLLSAHGQFVDDDGSEYTLEAHEFNQVLLDGTFVHPTTGNILKNARDMVIPFFVLSMPNDLEVSR